MCLELLPFPMMRAIVAKDIPPAEQGMDLQRDYFWSDPMIHNFVIFKLTVLKMFCKCNNI